MPNDSTNSVFPRARSEKLSVQSLGDEVLVYDLLRDKAHCLSHPVALVWNACDGAHSVESLVALLAAELKTEVDDAVVWSALEQLGRLHLLEEKVSRPGPKMSRRDLARLAAGAALIPAIATILAPTPAQAATCRGTGERCTSNGQCCSGRCVGAVPSNRKCT